MSPIADPDNPGLYFPDAPTDEFDEDALNPGLYLVGTTDVTGVSFSWAGVDFTVDGPYFLQKVEGWSAPPDGSADDVRVAGRHGSIVTPMTRRARVVTLDGVCVSLSVRDELFRFLDDSMAVAFADGSGTSPLAGWVAGRTLTAEAQLQRFAPLTEQARWGRGVFPFTVQWRCPDPLRYGAPVVVSSPINTAVSGLAFPWTFPVTFPSNPIGGSVSVVNGGNARAPVVVTLTGPLDGPGVVCVESSVRVEFPLTLGASDVLTVDSGSGVALLNGEYRAPSVLSSLVGDLSLRPGRQTLQALGVPSSGSPGISVSFRPAFW